MIILTIKENADKIYRFTTGFPVVADKECVRVVKITSEAKKYFQSDDAGINFKVKKKEWNSLNQKQRLEIALSTVADGNPFTYEIED